MDQSVGVEMTVNWLCMSEFIWRLSKKAKESLLIKFRELSRFNGILFKAPRFGPVMPPMEIQQRPAHALTQFRR